MRRKVYFIVPAVLASVAALGWMGMSLIPGKSDGAASGKTDVVSRGPLVISITEGGEIEAKTSTKIANELNWSVVIKKVVPEGTLVHKGDLIIKFDCQDLTDTLDQQQINVSEAESGYTEASENLELTRKQVDNTVQKSEQKVIDAGEALERYIKGDGPLAEKNAISDIQLAKRDLTMAKDKLDFKLKVNKDPELNSPYSANEIKADELGVERLRLSLEKAESQLDMLRKYENPKQIRTLKSAVDDAKLDLERDRIQSKTQMATAQASERSRKSSLAKQKEVLADLLDKQTKLTVKAEQDGLVVYVVGSKGRRNNNMDVVIDVGEKIDPHRQLMIVPDMKTLQVRTKVYESMIEQVRPGLPAYVRLDAKPGLMLTGKITEVSVLPDSSQWWSPDVKVFTVAVKLDQEVKGLKPGMTAQVEVILATLPADTLSIPVAALFSEQEKHFCWRVRDGAEEKVPVKIGRMSDTRLEILDGLKEGDAVRLWQPVGKQSGDKKDQPANTPATDKRPK